MTKQHILIIDDESLIRESLNELLTLQGYSCHTAENFKEAMTKLSLNNFSVVLTDINLPDNNGLEVIKSVKKYYPDILTIVITGYGSVVSAVEALQAGAYDYLTKPIDDDALLRSIQKAFDRLSVKSTNSSTAGKSDNHIGSSDIIGNDIKMQKIHDMVESVANSKATVLITGQSGTGKTLTAREIHRLSDRRNKPFVEVSCGSLTDTLLESELFGHVKGAFTGATNDKDGKFLAADGGTIFLDEINSASPALQVKLLRAIQERQFEPVGSNQTRSVDVRIILATNKDLAELVQKNEFREDLFYRINVINIELPNLADRPDDVTILANYFLNKMCIYHNKKHNAFSQEVLTALKQYNWPGNVRELENAIERAVVLGRSENIVTGDLPDTITSFTPKPAGASNVYPEPITLKKALETPEKAIIIAALQKFEWNRNKTAEVLDINRTTLYKKMKYYNLTGS